jgi:hypothetical protein
MDEKKEKLQDAGGENRVLQARIRHLSNELFLIKQEYADTRKKYFEIYTTLEKKVEERTRDLQDALGRIKALSGLLPICSRCKKIRDDKGYWNQIDLYIEQHSDAAFSHGICPDCMDEMYGGEEWYTRKNQRGK